MSEITTREKVSVASARRGAPSSDATLVFIPHGDEMKPVALLMNAYLCGIMGRDVSHVFMFDRRAPIAQPAAPFEGVGGRFKHVVHVGTPAPDFVLHERHRAAAMSITFSGQQDPSHIVETIRLTLRTIDEALLRILPTLAADTDVGVVGAPTFTQWFGFCATTIARAVTESFVTSVATNPFVQAAVVLAAGVFPVAALEDNAEFYDDVIDEKCDDVTTYMRTVAASVLAAVAEDSCVFVSTIARIGKAVGVGNAHIASVRPLDRESVRVHVVADTLAQFTDLVRMGDARRRTIALDISETLTESCADGGPGNFVVCFTHNTSPRFIRALRAAFPDRIGVAVVRHLPAQIIGQLHVDRTDVFSAVLAEFRKSNKKDRLLVRADEDALVITWSSLGLGAAFVPDFLLDGASSRARSQLAFVFRPA